MVRRRESPVEARVGNKTGGVSSVEPPRRRPLPRPLKAAGDISSPCICEGIPLNIEVLAETAAA